MHERVFRSLAEHLNRLPGGFASSDTGADLRLLERLFSPDEAELAVHLTLDQETAEIIAGRAGLLLSQVGPRLDEMAQKGLIFVAQAPDGSSLYQAVPMVVGIYEYQIKHLSQELLADFDAYWPTAKASPPVDTIPQLRTIPVGESIDLQLNALSYEQVTELVKSNDRFAVTTCICRHTAKMRGGGCQAPEESCLMFGDWADYYVRTGRGRSVDRSEVFEILARADAANLVLRPSNSKTISLICTCCGCCCGSLANLKKNPRPADIVASAFIARLNAEVCQACWTCLDRCQMEALVAGDGRVILKSERCIGCGLCVTTCLNKALTLERKPETVRTQVPPTMQATWQIMAEAQARVQ
jgi:Na+-translocating ferredoxin:NAD+ oxidoreductase subunit B